MRKLSLAMMGIATAALMTMVSCRKPVNGVVTPGEARTVTFTATTESNDGSKTAVSDHDILWKEGDKISVNGEEMTLASGDGTTSGTFVGDISATAPYYIGYAETVEYNSSDKTLKLNIPSSWEYDANNVVVPMAAYTTEEGNISFKNAVNVLKLNLNGNDNDGSTLKSIVLSHAKANLNGDITVEFKDGELTFREAEGTKATKTTTVSFGDAGLKLTSETTSIYIVLPKIGSDDKVNNDIKVTFNCANGRCIEKTITYKSEFNNVNQLISNGDNTLTVDATDATTLSGEFTVGSNSKGEPKTIKFSRGNLWYGEKGESKTKTWNLEDNQWDFKFTGEDDECYWDPDHVSHFFWSNTYDWKISSNEPYADVYNYGNIDISDIFFTNATQTTPNNDFTVEGQTGWRTLSSAEWHYLVSEREKASDLRGFTIIEGVYGLVLLPDDRNEELSEIESAEDLIAANAVFLPVAGSRANDGDSRINNISEQLHYWSSTPNESSEECAMRLYSNNGGKPEIMSEERQLGCCIRLVK